MDAEEFRTRGREMIDYITEYLEGITSRPAYPRISPGYLRELIPDEAPHTGESWAAVKADIERVIMPGVSSDAKVRNKIGRFDIILDRNSGSHLADNQHGFRLRNCCNSIK